MNDINNETIRYDCFRGCSVTEDPSSGEQSCRYRRGCCKLQVYDYLKGVTQADVKDVFEVRFKNTRKGFYRNTSGQSIKLGDLVVVEAANGHDLGIVTLEGAMVARQMAAKGFDMSQTELRRIYRRAKSFDIAKWQEAIAREHETMIKARRIAAEMGLEMKIGDVEFQGDGTKAIFYYIADGRVDFRQLIKVFAEEFSIRIEMKQIGARQEAGRIGGTGPCGRELCCATWMKNFVSVSTAAARFQDISLNPQKLAGMCAKLKCCLNYEVDDYIEHGKRMPSREVVLQTQDADYFHFKSDILAGLVTYSTDKRVAANLKTITAQRAKEIIEMNRRGEKPLDLQSEDQRHEPEGPIDLLAGDSITRFDKAKKKKKKNKKAEAKKGDDKNDDAKKAADKKDDAKKAADKKDDAKKE